MHAARLAWAVPSGSWDVLAQALPSTACDNLSVVGPMLPRAAPATPIDPHTSIPSIPETLPERQEVVRRAGSSAQEGVLGWTMDLTPGPHRTTMAGALGLAEPTGWLL